MEILARYCGAASPMQSLSAVCSVEDVLAMQQQVKTVYASPEVRAYVAALCAATRGTPYLTLGASTRAAIALVRAAQGSARDFLEISALREIELDVVIVNKVLFLVFGDGIVRDETCFSRHGVFLFDLFKLSCDELFQLLFGAERFAQVFDFALEIFIFVFSK